MKMLRLCGLCSHPNVLTFSPPDRGCSEGLDAFRFFFENTAAVGRSIGFVLVELLLFEEKSERT